MVDTRAGHHTDAPEVRHANFDLQVNVTDEGVGGGLGLEFVYNADLFDDLTVSSFAGRFERFLNQVSVDPNGPVGQIDLLDSAERALLVPAHGAVDRLIDLDFPVRHLLHAALRRRIRPGRCGGRG